MQYLEQLKTNKNKHKNTINSTDKKTISEIEYQITKPLDTKKETKMAKKQQAATILNKPKTGYTIQDMRDLIKNLETAKSDIEEEIEALETTIRIFERNNNA